MKKQIDYQTAHSEVENALDECGIGHDLTARFNTAATEIAAFCADLQARATQQALYDLVQNVPCGVMTRNEANAAHAIRSAIAGAVGKLVEWGIEPALEIAADIAEDVNAHAEAEKIRLMAKAT